MPQEAPAQYNYDKRRLVLGLVSIFLVYGVIGYFIQAMNVARPKIAADLDGMALYSWSVSIPGLVGAFVTLIYGKLSDMYGRRIMLLISVSFALAGSVLSVFSNTFVFLIIATAIGSLGVGAIMPLVFSVLGDMFPPVERSKWVGLLQIPMGIAALCGPALGGWFVENLGWQYFFWSTVPLLILCLILIPIGIPPLATRGMKHKIDYLGCLLVTLATGTTIIGVSLGGVTYPWASTQIIGLLAISLISWIFFFRVEYRVEEPVLDPLVLRNKSFNIVAAASFLAFFGQMAMMMYLPMFLQGIQDISATNSGWIIAPLGWLMAFIGVPVGFILARTRRYKWMYIVGYGLVTAAMFGVTQLSEDTHFIFSVLACTVAGLGLGAIPTVNTMVVQNAVPKRLLGAAMGAIFFCLMFGVAISPAILGAVEQATYKKTLDASLPDGLEHMTDLIDSQVLLSEPDMERLENAFKEMGSEGSALLQQTVVTIRSSMAASIRSVFWIGAVTMLLAFLLIITVPEIPIGEGQPE
jgi:MFS family permease